MHDVIGGLWGIKAEGLFLRKGVEREEMQLIGFCCCSLHDNWVFTIHFLHTAPL